MEGGFANAQIICCLLCFCLVCCVSKPVKDKTPDLSFTQSGDLIYRFGNGFFSGLFRDFSTQEKRFSHVGIIYRPHHSDSIFVLHAEASELTGIGGVRKDRAGLFLHKVNEWAIYRVQASLDQRREIARQALNHHSRKVPFDRTFDVMDTSAVYCTELVARCVNKALHTELIQQRTTRAKRRFIAIDDTYLVDGVELVQKQIAKTQHNGRSSH